MKGKHKVYSEVSQRTQESSSPSGYELHSFDLYYYAWHFTSLLANLSLCGGKISLRATRLLPATCEVLHLYYLTIKNIFLLRIYLLIAVRAVKYCNTAPLPLMWRHQSATCDVIEIWSVLQIDLSHRSEVSQLRHPGCSQPAQATPILAKLVLEHSGLSPSQCSAKGFTMCCEVRGIKATTNICSEKQPVRPS